MLRALDAVAALDEDVTSLMTAVPALVRAIRYGTVRGTPSGSLSAVVDALVIRICAALPGSVGGLADDAAARLREAMDGLHAALAVYGDAAARGGRARAGQSRERWIDALGGLAGRRDVHGLVAGRVTRMLADAGALSWAEAATRFQAALSVGVPPAAKAAWAEGFLGSPADHGGPGGGSGGGLLLVHDADLLGVLDQWVASLGARGLRRGAAAAAADVRRVYRTGAGGDRAGRAGARRAGRAGRGGRARRPGRGAASTRRGRRGCCARSRSSSAPGRTVLTAAGAARAAAGAGRAAGAGQ